MAIGDCILSRIGTVDLSVKEKLMKIQKFNQILMVQVGLREVRHRLEIGGYLMGMFLVMGIMLLFIVP